MKDIRLETLELTLNGKVYNLCCNFGVLADVDFSLGGVQNALNSGSFAATSTFLVAMLNDFERRVGSGIRYTRDDVHRLLADYPGSAAELANSVIGMVLAAVGGRSASAEKDTESENDEKN